MACAFVYFVSASWPSGVGRRLYLRHAAANDRNSWRRFSGFTDSDTDADSVSNDHSDTDVITDDGTVKFSLADAIAISPGFSVSRPVGLRFADTVTNAHDTATLHSI